MKTAAIALTAAAALAFPAGASALTRSFEGTVVSVDRSAHTFRLSDAERGVKRIRVTSQTVFHDLAGFAALKRGAKNIEVTARRSNGRWIARVVERSGGGGQHGGHGADDR